MLVRCKNWANLLLLASVRNLHLFRSSNREANIEQEFISIDVMPQNAAFFVDGKCRKWMALVKISETWLKASEAPHKTKLNREFGEETDKKKLINGEIGREIGFAVWWKLSEMEKINWRKTCRNKFLHKISERRSCGWKINLQQDKIISYLN